ncbi:MAG TPA: hypothetical protein VHT27_09465 [Solirubrobacteraceae bacterium]|nr:hypothetical protein [Solirubrobacteraceae bacterium]
MSTARRRLVAALACALALFSALAAVTQAATHRASQGLTTVAKPPASATVEGCATAFAQSERSATFVGEMQAIPGSARMQMRIELLERGGDEASLRSITYPGLGSWLRASPGVKTYKNIDKVTDLAAPAEYRAAIHFRWLNSHGRPIKYLDLRTPRCQQALPPGATSELAAPAGDAPQPAA